MLQEIITYIIIAVAVVLAVQKMYRKLSVKKKKTPSRAVPKKHTSSVLHNCSDCIAACSLRDAVPAVRKEKKEVCETNVKLVKDE